MSKFRMIVVVLMIISFSKPANAQVNNPINRGNFYAGLDIRIATLLSKTSVKTIMGFKVGYNHKISENGFVGPQVQALFIRSPVNKGARISLFAGPSAELEMNKKMNQMAVKTTSYFSNRVSWIFPLNQRTSDYTYKDCISISTSINNDEFLGFNKSSINLNIDFQRYDIGFYTGFNRMINVSTGSITSF